MLTGKKIGLLNSHPKCKVSKLFWLDKSSSLLKLLDKYNFFKFTLVKSIGWSKQIPKYKYSNCEFNLISLLNLNPSDSRICKYCYISNGDYQKIYYNVSYSDKDKIKTKNLVQELLVRKNELLTARAEKAAQD